MNAYIKTPTGLVTVIDKVSYTVEQTHPNYQEIVDAVRQARWSDVPALINNLKVTATEQLQQVPGITVNADGSVSYEGRPVPHQLAAQITQLLRDNFDLSMWARFVHNLFANPSYRSMQELFGWMQANGLTVTEDGHFLAWKRVREDYTSFHDGTTMNKVGTFVEMPRNAVDDDSDNTCSYGLHFCSQSYLPHYSGGQGRVLLLKINPADVVSIPTDYNNAKGRACKYFVVDEVHGEARQQVEEKELLVQPVMVDTSDINKTEAYKQGYECGYKDGRGKKARGTSNVPQPTDDLRAEFNVGYNDGREDGRRKLPKRFSAAVAQGAEHLTQAVNALALAIETIVGVQPPCGGWSATDQTTLFQAIGADELDMIEILMTLEDELDIDLTHVEETANVTISDMIRATTAALAKKYAN